MLLSEPDPGLGLTVSRKGCSLIALRRWQPLEQGTRHPENLARTGLHPNHLVGKP